MVRTLNLGILAHVDAGKTTLTERLLYAAGVIDEIGSVDRGTTQTDSLALERRRGITIKSAVVSFDIRGVGVNLIDTPGHPEFIAEVERVLSVLDGAVLVISAVEGVQANTRVLMRTLQRLRIPTLIFVNKLDRRGAGYGRLLDAIAAKLTGSIVAMGSVAGAGTKGCSFAPFGAADAEFLERLTSVVAEHDEDVLATYVDDARAMSLRNLTRALARQTKQARAHPVFFGSAITGAGVAELMAGVAELLPAKESDVSGPVSGTVFKVERGPAGEKIAFARMFSGELRIRDRVVFGDGNEAKLTDVQVFVRGGAAPAVSVGAGQIGKLWGLRDVRIGDAIGQARVHTEHHFPPPTLETVVVPTRPADGGALRAALDQLEEQDPLINVRQDDGRRELYVSLYGEVQKEVIQATLADDFGIDVGFRETSTIFVERPVGIGAAAEIMHTASNPFLATVGLRIEPAPEGSGVRFGLEVELGSMPIAFFRAVEDTVRTTFGQGLQGWEVIDCAVTMTHSGYEGRHSHGHQRFAKELSSTGADFRGLTPLVLMDALKGAGTVVCEPILHFRLEVPEDSLASMLPALVRLHAVPQTQAIRGSVCTLEGDIPAARVHELQQRLPDLTLGEGALESVFDRYQPVRGRVPVRARTDHNPLDRKEYLMHVTRGV